MCIRDSPCDGHGFALHNQAHVAQQVQADRMEGADGHAPHRALAAEPLLKALAHLGSGLIREGHGGDLIRFDAAPLDQMRDARDQGFGLARTRPGDDRDRGLRRLHRCRLYTARCV